MHLISDNIDSHCHTKRGISLVTTTHEDSGEQCPTSGVKARPSRLGTLGGVLRVLRECLRSRTWETMKSAMPCASMRFRSASCVSAGSGITKMSRDVSAYVKVEPDAGAAVASQSSMIGNGNEWPVQRSSTGICCNDDVIMPPASRRAWHIVVLKIPPKLTSRPGLDPTVELMGKWRMQHIQDNRKGAPFCSTNSIC